MVVRPSRIGTVSLVLVITAGLLVGILSSPALAACSSDKSNTHTVGSVFHGWDRFFCQPANNYKFNGYTNHGHGQKYVAIWNSPVTGNPDCDNLASGSVNAFCSAIVADVHHQSYNDIAAVQGSGYCTDRFPDGHGFDCHFMEPLP